MAGIRKQFEVAEIPSEMSGTQLAFEAGKWKAKFETLKEVLDYERKKRKEVETNLNKLAYELGGVKNEVRKLEARIKLLSGAANPIKTDEQPIEAKKEVRQPLAAEVSPKIEELEPERKNLQDLLGQRREKVAAGVVKETNKTESWPMVESEPEIVTEEPPRLYIKFVAAKPEIKPEIKAEIKPESKFVEPINQGDENTGDIMVALETSFKSEAGETWGYATALMHALKNYPAELYKETAYNYETKGGTYYDFANKFQKLIADYGNYRELVPTINDELQNLDKVIPYVSYYLADYQHEA